MHDRKPDHSASPTIEAMIGPIIGIDEAGRGCLAGPVVAAAVILPHGPLQSELMHSEPTSTIKSHLCMTPHLESLGLGGLADSKKLTEAQRDALAPRIRQHAVAWGLGVVWPSTIDEINILQSTFLAMARAVNSMHRQGALMLIDGNKTIPASAFHASQAFQHNGIDKSATPQHAIVGGDDIVPAISAASILAKTYRDKLMVAFDKRYPAYGFAKHKGYGTKDHLAALMEHGPCPQHRITFRGVVQEHGENPSPITQATPLLLC
ncbi:MAG: ribonuclease HII [Pseudomonadota bacterium]